MKLYYVALLSLGLLSTGAYACSTCAHHKAKTEQTMQSPAEKNKMAGDAFLNANKHKPGVTTLPDGLQYKVLVDGKGAIPTSNDQVTVNYTGTLINGTVFDSSYRHGQAITFPVQNVIPGWVEALQLMKVGSTWELYIPAKLAYGEQGAPPSIGPNETLIFKVQLLDVKKV